MADSASLDGPRASSIVGVFPHPDDEAYSCAGALALAAHAGANVHLVFLTRGELGARHAGMPPGDALAAVRTRETETSREAIGATDVTWMDIPDGGIAAADAEATSLRLAAVLERLAANVVVTLGRDGVYGHRDHTATTTLVEAAFACGDQARRRLLFSAFPQGHFAPVYRSLRKRRGDSFVVDLNETAIGIARDHADLILDIRQVAARKRSSILAHASQLPGDNPADLLFPGIMGAFFEEEWFTLAAGPSLPPDARTLTDLLVPSHDAPRG